MSKLALASDLRGYSRASHGTLNRANSTDSLSKQGGTNRLVAEGRFTFDSFLLCAFASKYCNIIPTDTVYSLFPDYLQVMVAPGAWGTPGLALSLYRFSAMQRVTAN